MIKSNGAAEALVVFEDGCPDIERAAMAIAERLEGGGFEAKALAASAVSIPDILAAKLFALGAETKEAPSYAEIARVLSGINLAGRKAIFFGSSGAAVARLRTLCADTEVSAAHSDLVGKRLESAAIAAWLRGVA